jgi:DNA-binding MarR family transcriptional regulator
MSQTVNRLTSAGYAVRNPDPADGRRVLFTATDAGSAVAKESRARAESWFNAQLAAMTDEDRELLSRASVVLKRLADG